MDHSVLALVLFGCRTEPLLSGRLRNLTSHTSRSRHAIDPCRHGWPNPSVKQAVTCRRGRQVMVEALLTVGFTAWIAWRRHQRLPTGFTPKSSRSTEQSEKATDDSHCDKTKIERIQLPEKKAGHRDRGIRHLQVASCFLLLLLFLLSFLFSLICNRNQQKKKKKKKSGKKSVSEWSFFVQTNIKKTEIFPNVDRMNQWRQQTNVKRVKMDDEQEPSSFFFFC